MSTATVTQDHGISPEIFDALIRGLSEAKNRFRAEDSGRGGVIDSLSAVLNCFKENPALLEVLDPLIALMLDLKELDKGTPSTMLTPKRKSSPPANMFYEAVKGVSDFTVNRLIATGMTRDDARKDVAKALNDEGIRPARRGRGLGYITARTLRKWADDISMSPVATKLVESSEVAFIDGMEKIFDQELPGFSLQGIRDVDMLLRVFPTSEVRRGLLESLKEFIAIMPPRKPSGGACQVH